LMGLAGYTVLFFLMVLWNFWALWRATVNRWSSPDGLMTPLNLAVAGGYLFVFVAWGPYVLNLWIVPRTVFALAYGAASVLVVFLLWSRPETRRLRNYLFAVYNLVGTLAVAAWAAADAGSDGLVMLNIAAQGWGIAQTYLVIWGAFFGPIFFLPPMLLIEPRREDEEEDTEMTVDPGTGVVSISSSPQEGVLPPMATAVGKAVVGEGSTPGRRKRGPVRRVVSLGIDAFMGALVVLLLVFSAIGAVNVASWNDLPDPGEEGYDASPGFEFAAIGRAFTDRRFAVPDWSSVVDEEVDRARDLGLAYIRYDLQKEFIEDPREMVKLDSAVVRIRDAGMDLMFGPFGSSQWEFDPPTFEEYVEEIRKETLLLVELYEPAWVLPFFEPNGQVAVNLGEKLPVEVWIPVIDSLGEEIYALSNETRVLIEVAIEPEQGIELVEALSEPGLNIDAIGVDLYLLSTDGLDSLQEYRDAATNDELGFWVSEFGVESVMSGQRGQARALAEVLRQASGELNASGLCVWALLDDTVIPSNLGLVGRDGTPKEAYRVLREAIDEILGD
ncbi:MAG: hypothetical protein KAS77_02150, partial [Thermoplasmata archaeon]|nr:hypothetical protein [Thermoplasmata archaeon]